MGRTKLKPKYQVDISKGEAVLAAQRAALEREQSVHAALALRERVLCGLIHTQEQLELILTAQQRWDAGCDGGDEQPALAAGGDGQGQPQAEQWHDSERGDAPATAGACGCYALGRFAAATPVTLARVRAMACGDWLDNSVQSFQALTVLLELAGRDEPAANEEEGCGDGCGDGGGDGDCDGDGGGGGGGAATYASEAQQQLEALMDDATTLTLAATHHAPAAIYEAALLNAATRAPAAAHAEHWVMVARRCRFSAQQLDHMRVVMEEYSRLLRATAGETEDLAARIERISVQPPSAADSGSGGSAPPGSSGAPSPSPSGSSASAAAGGGSGAPDAGDEGGRGSCEAMLARLASFAVKRNVLAQLINVYLTSPLTRRQLALLFVGAAAPRARAPVRPRARTPRRAAAHARRRASARSPPPAAAFPFLPPMGVVAEAAVALAARTEGRAAPPAPAPGDRFEREVEEHMARYEAHLAAQHARWLQSCASLQATPELAPERGAELARPELSSERTPSGGAAPSGSAGAQL
ncbi:hypothetical protein HT031_004569 [Scenedesmus sp. PABB004]|nr:hypothetical protein HT031_004569 [Scenedesmus sp. PABB004]